MLEEEALDLTHYISHTGQVCRMTLPCRIVSFQTFQNAIPKSDLSDFDKNMLEM
jgi:hypothetical protein